MNETAASRPGTLFVVATPIGNLGDFSPRAVETLETVDFIAAEDTRVGARLLNHFGIKKPQICYFEHNRRTKGELIAARLLAGESCALITDAGTPAISDPGTDLVALCAREGIPVASVPGCCAIPTALSISGRSRPKNAPWSFTRPPTSCFALSRICWTAGATGRSPCAGS